MLYILEPKAAGRAQRLEEDTVAEVIHMDRARRQLAAKRGFASWSQRFHEPFNEHTLLSGLEAATLGTLVQAGEGTTMAMHKLVMGVLDLGTDFYALSNTQKLTVMDIAIFLLDQVRFECMRRLGWVEDYETRDVPVLELILRFPTRYAGRSHSTPALAASHTRYGDYQREMDIDRAAFLRRLIPEAIEAFLKRLEDPTA